MMEAVETAAVETRAAETAMVETRAVEMVVAETEAVETEAMEMGAVETATVETRVKGETDAAAKTIGNAVCTRDRETRHTSPVSMCTRRAQGFQGAYL